MTVDSPDEMIAKAARDEHRRRMDALANKIAEAAKPHLRAALAEVAKIAGLGSGTAHWCWPMVAAVANREHAHAHRRSAIDVLGTPDLRRQVAERCARDMARGIGG